LNRGGVSGQPRTVVQKCLYVCVQMGNGAVPRMGRMGRMEGVYVRAGDGGSRVCSTYVNNFERGITLHNNAADPQNKIICGSRPKGQSHV